MCISFEYSNIFEYPMRIFEYQFRHSLTSLVKIQDVYQTVLAHACSYNRAHVSIFGTWFPFHHSYRIEGLDAKKIQSIFAARLRELENKLAHYELYFQFDWEKRKPYSLAYFFQ